MGAIKLPPEAARAVAAVPDQRTRELLAELWEFTERNARNPSELEKQAAERKRKWLDSMTYLERVCTRALNGDLGGEARAIAHRMLIDENGAWRGDEVSMRKAVGMFRRAR